MGDRLKSELAKERSEISPANNNNAQTSGGVPHQSSRESRSERSGNAGGEGGNNSDGDSNQGRSGRGRGRGQSRGRGRGRFPGRGRRQRNTSPNRSQDQGNVQPKEPKEPKAPRPPRPQREQVPSKTTLFVSNLPFSFREEDLAKTFEGTKFKEAHVALTRNGRSRGYGFVEFENEQDQQAALQAKNGQQVTYVTSNDKKEKTRNITVTIANAVEKDQSAPIEAHHTDEQ